ncbi:hypothetical protein AOLI_G00195250 [Acnodon oligacanthus]
MGSGLEIFQIIIPEQATKEVWETYHQSMGHPSSERMLATLRQHCYWPRMTQDVKEWTATCPQCVLAKTSQRQELDQARCNRRAKLAPLLPGERVLIRNFHRRAKGKLNWKLTPDPFVVVRQLREGQSVYLLQPEGKEAPTRTVHHNNLRPCPLNVLQDSQVPDRPRPMAIDQTDAPSNLVAPEIKCQPTANCEYGGASSGSST